MVWVAAPGVWRGWWATWYGAVLRPLGPVPVVLFPVLVVRAHIMAAYPLLKVCVGNRQQVVEGSPQNAHLVGIEGA